MPSEPDYKFSETNKYFTLLANVIHQHGGPTQEVEDLLAEIREKEKLVKPDCDVGLLTPESRKSIDKRFENISMAAIYKEEISEETLEIAARIYFEIVFCPDVDLQIVQFYRNLFQNFAMETILKTLTRILLEAKEKKHEHYQAAQTLFDKTTTMMDLEYRDIVAMTTGSSELKQYPRLKNHQVNQELSKIIYFYELTKNNLLVSPDIEELVNNPVHITEETYSAFIPFCSFGASMEHVGQKFTNFAIPVCRLFREKVVAGQVCYEADLSQFRKRVNWKEALLTGLTLIIDTNEEFDVKNIMEKINSEKKKTGKSLNVKNYKKENSFTVMLKTISMIYIFRILS